MQTTIYTYSDGSQATYMGPICTEITNDIEIAWYTGTGDNVSSGYYDLVSAILHEFGHWLDLADNQTNTSAVMYYQLTDGQSRRVLNSADTDPIQSLYEWDGIVNTPPPAPTNFTVSIVGQNAVLSWYEPTTGCTPSFMIVYKNGNIIANPDPSATSYTDVNATSSLPATYMIGAYVEGVGGQGCGGESDSPPISVIAAPPTISSNTTWSRVVYVNNNVSVNSGCTLTISPGTSVYFNSGSGYSLTANGQLNVQSAIFMSNSSSPSPGN